MSKISDQSASPQEADKAANLAIYEKYSDMIRPCSLYKEEYKDCKSILSRFNQYFIYGESLDCDQWRQDYNNCQKLSWLGDKEAAVELIKSELSRKAARLKAHYDNDIWEKREHPPEDWVKPLPDFMEQRNKGTILDVRSKELKKEEEKQKENQFASNKVVDEPNKSSFCTFM